MLGCCKRRGEAIVERTDSKRVRETEAIDESVGLLRNFSYVQPWFQEAVRRRIYLKNKKKWDYRIHSYTNRRDP